MLYVYLKRDNSKFNMQNMFMRISFDLLFTISYNMFKFVYIVNTYKLYWNKKNEYWSK